MIAVMINKRYRFSIQTDCEKVEKNDMLYLYCEEIEDYEALLYELEEKNIKSRIIKKGKDEHF